MNWLRVVIEINASGHFRSDYPQRRDVDWQKQSLMSKGENSVRYIPIRGDH
ncbi:MAG: hypothetical protein ACYCVD_08210 [Desulfitobacteriaceae bacterium]